MANNSTNNYSDVTAGIFNEIIANESTRLTDIYSEFDDVDTLPDLPTTKIDGDS